jgi:glutamate N-acetyltransferase/amino-acid N-acetyltransferase
MTLTLPIGFRAAGVGAGLKGNGALDVGLLVSNTPCVAAGVFTRNLVRAAPVVVSQAHLFENAEAFSGVVLNSGCANAVTGNAGHRDALAMCELAARATGARPDSFFVLSTGLIGKPLPMDRVSEGIHACAKSLAAEGGLAFARAMMTTDTREKWTQCDAHGARFVGFAKGAGMIHPDMATLLSVLVTDAVVTPCVLQEALKGAVDETFHALTIDGDTSTNDAVVVLANGRSGKAMSPAALQEALVALCRPLAKAIVSDGEGVHHVVALTVEGTATPDDARRIGRTVGTSLLVKTAVFGRDPNWGRILAAAGRSGIDFAHDACSLTLCGTLVLEQGSPVPFDKSAVSRAMGAKEWTGTLRVGSGPGRATVWFSDLSNDYVRLNSEYST